MADRGVDAHVTMGRGDATLRAGGLRADRWRWLLLWMVAALTVTGVGTGDGADAGPLDGEVVGLLLLGSDMGPARDSEPMEGRADAFQIVFARTDGSGAVVVSVPRDSWVPVTGRGTRRINDCLVGGAQRCVDTVEQLWGVPIDGWIVTGFWGFRDAVDGLGGVTMDVPGYLDGGGPPLEAGADQLLDGSHSLTWTRDRKHRANGDFDRTAAQGAYLRAAHAQLRDAARSPLQLAQMANTIRRSTLSSLSATDLLRLGVLAARTDPADVRALPLPGYVGWAGSASVVYLSSNAGDLVRAAADGR